MNIRFSSMLAVLASAATVFAAEPAPVVVNEAVPAAVETSAAVEAPATEIAAPAVEAAAPVEEVASVEEPSVTSDGAAPAPVAVRNADGARKPVKTYVVESRPASRTVVVQQSAQPVAAPAEHNPGYEPQKLNFGVQAFVGSFSLMDDVFDIFDSDASGMTWRVGFHTSLPLNKYTSSMKIGVLFEHSEASTSENNSYSSSRKVDQKKLYIPVLFDFKGPRSIVSFGVGTSVAIPLSDKFSFTEDNVSKTKHKFDMIDADQRVSLDWNFLMGLSIRPHKLVSFDIRYELGFNKLYEDEYDYHLDKSSNAFMMGLSFYPFSL